MTRSNDIFSAFFEIQLGNYFHNRELLNIVMDSLNIILKRNAHRKGLFWYQCLLSNLIYDNLYLIIMGAKFCDNFVNLLYDSPSDKCLKILDIDPGYGIFSLLYGNICSSEMSWLSYSNIQKVEQDYADSINTKYPVKRILGELQNPEFDLSEKYDLIVFCEVLEHFKYYPVQTMKKIAGWLNDGGQIFLSTPTRSGDPCRIYSSYNQLPEYDINGVKVASKTISNYLDQSEGHTHIYTKEELFEIFSACNLSVLEYKVINNHHRIILGSDKSTLM